MKIQTVVIRDRRVEPPPGRGDGGGREAGGGLRRGSGSSALFAHERGLLGIMTQVLSKIIIPLRF